MKKMIVGQLITVVTAVVVLTLALNFMLEIRNKEQKTDDEATVIFLQIEQILNQNSMELELSHIFSLLTTNDGSEIYAADSNSGDILGSTDNTSVGKNLSDLGLNIDTITTDKKGFHAKVYGESTYCVFTEFESILIGCTYPSATLYADVASHTTAIGIYLIGITAYIVIAITLYLNKNIIHGIADVNDKLTNITKGNFDTTVNVNTTPEFSELSEHINTMVTSILDTNDKISYILEKANLPICVYEYNENLTYVRATHQIGDILALDEEHIKILLSDHDTFKVYLEQLSEHALETDPTIYKLPIETERYIKMESFKKDDSIMGFIMDATSEVLRRQSIEYERDMDLLTQLYNRRALEYKLEKLFKHPEALKHAAMIMLDSDGLKNINDRYGHKAGDRYLCETADLLRTINAPKQIIARQGGDEFVIFFYACESHDELMECIETLTNLREETYFEVEDGISLPVNYSFGYAIYQVDGDDYITLLREADMRMYVEKRERKKGRV